MAHEFRLPDIGEGLTEAEVVSWLVPVGGEVAVDEPVVEVETDKAVVEIPSPYGGTVLHHGAGEGETVRVGDILVVIGEPGEGWEGGDSAAPPGAEAVADEPAPIVGTIPSEAETVPPVSASSTTRGGVKALPVVRKLARDLGVDLTRITGTGPDGRITRQDVEAAAAGTGATPPAGEQPSVRVPAAPVAPPPPRSPAGSGEGSDQRIKMSRLRRTIAANMSASWAEIPHVTTFDDVDAARLLAARQALQRRHDVAVPLEALVVKAVIPALDAFPEFHATLDGDELVVHGRHDIGVAVDTPDGLLVAVIKDAASLPVMDLAGEVRRLGAGARDRSLPPDELTGQTFTVSNIGAVGGGHGTPIVPYGTTAILSVGRAVERPVARDGTVTVSTTMPLSLSYDHRVIDGAVGRRFMTVVMENLEEPALFLA